jgi:hypothetical protein
VSRPPRPAGLFLAAAASALLVVLTACGPDPSADRARQAEVLRRGAEVMPFELDATTHTFRKTADGGVQVVRSDDPAADEQVALVRAHLRRERDRFAQGDFSDPARIHGMDMPGVAELQAGAARIRVTYRDRPDGAQLRYRTRDRDLVAAVHAWFDRQVMDHGAHAQDD